MPHTDPDIEQDQQLSLGDMIDRARRIAVRRRWYIIGAASVVALGTIVGLSFLPNRYTSEATIFAVQQRIPERYVVPTATSDVSQALEAMVQEILSRPRLLAIIDELGLYKSQRESMEAEQLIQLIRHAITVEPIARMLGRGEVNAFKVSFVDVDPQVAQAVTHRLTTLFIEQNLKTRSDQATTTTEFLQEQLETAKKDLQAQEQRLRDFKMQYLGELPEQQQGNLGILGGLQSQLENVMGGRNHAQQQRLYLESLLNEYQRRGRRATRTAVSSTGQIITPLQAAQDDLTRLETEKKNLLAAYTRNHPDVVRKEQEIELQQMLVETFRAAKHTVPDAKKPSAQEDVPASEDEIVVAQLKSQLQANGLELDNLAKKEQKLHADIDHYQSRLNLTPVREQQLTSLQRDYELLRQHYGELLKKQQESRLATDLEKRQEGQQFRLADPPNLPTAPSSPQRVKISLLGLLGGLVFGCALAFVVDFRDSSFRSENDVKRRLELPLVVGIPVVRTPAEERARSYKRAFEWVAASVLLAVVAIAEYYVYRHG